MILVMVNFGAINFALALKFICKNAWHGLGERLSNKGYASVEIPVANCPPLNTHVFNLAVLV